MKKFGLVLVRWNRLNIVIIEIEMLSGRKKCDVVMTRYISFSFVFSKVVTKYSYYHVSSGIKNEFPNVNKM